MGRISRDDLCACGSQLRYNDCCFREIKDFMLFGKNCRDFPEKFALGKLLKSSRNFQRFYSAERPKIQGEIHWIEDPSLPRGIKYRNTTYKIREGEEIRLIRSPLQFPIRSTDDMIIAHELMHIIIEREGFLSVGFRDQRFESLASSLSSMVNDLVVDKRLKLYDFDLKRNTKKETRENYRNLRNKTSPSEMIDKLLWAFNYEGNVLNWYMVYEDEPNKENHFKLWFDQEYSDIAQIGSEIDEIVARNGYETPEKTKALFQEIISQYDLNRFGLALE